MPLICLALIIKPQRNPCQVSEVEAYCLSLLTVIVVGGAGGVAGDPIMWVFI